MPDEFDDGTSTDPFEEAEAGLDATLDDDDGIQEGDAENDELTDEQLGPNASFSRSWISRSPMSFGPGGQAAAGDIYNTYYAAAAVRVIPGAVHDEEIERLRAVHVQTESFRQLVDRMPAWPVQVLWGDPSSGRHTAAILALAQRGLRVQLLDAEPGQEALTAMDLEPCGYIIEYDVKASEKLSRSLLASLRQRAEQAGARLVVLPDTSAKLDPSELGEEVVQHTPPPPLAVLRAHLRQRLSESHVDRAEAALRKPSLQAFLQRRLEEATRSPGRIGGLVETLASYATDQLTDDQLHEEFRVEQRDKVRKWFDGASSSDAAPASLPQRALLLTTSILNGFPLHRVMAAADRLAVRLSEFESGGTPAPRQVFHSDLHASASWLEVGRGLARSGLPGSRRTRRVWLRSPRLQKIVLDVAWQEFEAVHGPLADWLGELTARRSDLVWDAAVRTVGTLATFDYDHVEELFLRRWVRSDDPRRRRAAALALAYAAEDPSVRPAARGTLRQWSDPTSSAKRRQAALLAYQYGVGVVFPPTSRWIAVLLDRLPDEVDVVPLLARITELGFAGVVLETLVGDGTPGDARTLLALVRGRPAPWRAAALLTAVGASEASQQALTHLLLVALTWEDTRADAWDALRTFVTAVQDQPDLLPVLAEVFSVLLSVPRLYQPLHLTFRLWAHQDAAAAPTIQTLLIRTGPASTEGNHDRRAPSTT